MTEELRWGQALRWGLIGCGKISHDFGKALDKATKPHKVVACAASSLERAQKFAKEHFPDATPYGSYEELLKDSQIDAVYVGVHNEAHCPWAAKAVEAGKHVLCEKPFGTCAGEVRQTIKRLKNRKTFLMEAFWSRFFPSWRYIRNIVDTKEWGEPRVVQANFGYPHEDNWRCNERAEGALTLYGLYVIMLAHYIYKRKPEKVSVVGAKDKEHDSDEWATIVLEYGPQQRAVLYYDSRTWLPQNAFVAFDKGHITLPEYFWCPEKLVRWEGETWYNNEHNKKTIEFPLDDDRFFNYNHSSGLRYEADHLYEQVAKGQWDNVKESLSSNLVPICGANRRNKWILAVRFEVARGILRFAQARPKPGTVTKTYSLVKALRYTFSGRIESDFHPLSATLEIVETMDEVRRQLGVHFPHDDRFK